MNINEMNDVMVKLRSVWLLLILFSPNISALEAKATGISIHVETASKSVDPNRIVIALIPSIAHSSESEGKKIIQSNATFDPFVTIAQPGSIIEFPNLDEFAHHVYSFSKAMPFELPLYGRDDKQDIQLENPGVILLGCNIHDWMFGYIVVLDTPYAALLDKNYEAEFKRLPVGEYQLAIWHPSMEEAWLQPVSISSEDSHFLITLPVPISLVAPLPTPSPDDWEDY